MGAAPGDLCGESSTHYTKLPTHPRTVERLAAAVPGARLVYVMRHPVDRLVSHYVHAWTTRDVSCPIDEAVERHRELVDYGRYAMQLRPYVEAFGRDAILPVFHGRLRAHPCEELGRVGGFIGLGEKAGWDDSLGEQNVSRRRLRRSPARDAILGLPGMAALRRTLVPERVRERIKRRWMLTERPALSAASRERVEAIFDEDLAELGGLLGVELRCDNFDDVTRDVALGWTRKETPATSAA
jgi:hypothetical protein